MSSEPSTSSDSSLLYSEYINTRPEEVTDNKKKEKPVIKFTKSLVLARVIGLLSALKESEKDLKKKPAKERNIEVCEEGAPVVEMNVAVLKKSSDAKSAKGCLEMSSDSEDSDSDENTNLPEYLSGILEKDVSNCKVFKLITEPAVSEPVDSSLKKEIHKLSQDLKSENTVIENAFANSELERPPAKKICVV